MIIGNRTVLEEDALGIIYSFQTDLAVVATPFSMTLICCIVALRKFMFNILGGRPICASSMWLMNVPCWRLR